MNYLEEQFWSNEKEPPELLSDAQNGFSVDVLVYFPCLDENTIGWFQYSTYKWFFLSNQDYANREFYWRYLFKELDKIHLKNKEDEK